MTSPPGPPPYGQPQTQFSAPPQQTQPPYQPGQPGGQPAGPPPYQPYGQPGQPQPYGQRATYAPPSRRPVSVTGLILVVLGAVGLGLSFTILHWFHGAHGVNSTDSGVPTTFAKVHKQIEQIKSSGVSKYISFGVSDLYFAWLAWALAAAALVFGLLAVSQLGTRAPAVKFIGALIAAAGIGLTAWAVDLYSASGPLVAQAHGQDSYSYYLKHTSFGAWAAAAGFLLIFVGSLIPARRG